jgi:hypothetical protein
LPFDACIDIKARGWNHQVCGFLSNSRNLGIKSGRKKFESWLGSQLEAILLGALL